MYDSTHYGMGSTMEASTLRSSKPKGVVIPELRIMATYSTS
jgi:hypothetical protein